MTVFERSPEAYAEQYLHGKRMRITRNIAYGSKMAEGLENDEATGDPLLDLVMARLPKYELRDKIIECKNGVAVEYRDPNTGIITHPIIPALDNGKERIPLLAKPDTAKSDYSAFREYKSSTRKWTQKMVDDSGQIGFYATAIWLATGKIPETIHLDDVQTAYDPDGRLYPTGNIWTFPTKRTMMDVIKMTKRIRNAWKGIKQLCEDELL